MEPLFLVRDRLCAAVMKAVAAALDPDAPTDGGAEFRQLDGQVDRAAEALVDRIRGPQGEVA